MFVDGVWTGGAADAAKSAVENRLQQMHSLIAQLEKAIAWYSMIARVVVDAKLAVNDNLLAAQDYFSVIRKSPELEPGEKEALIQNWVRSQNVVNTAIILGAMAKVPAFTTWQPPPQPVRVPHSPDTSAASVPKSSLDHFGPVRLTSPRVVLASNRVGPKEAPELAANANPHGPRSAVTPPHPATATSPTTSSGGVSTANSPSAASASTPSASSPMSSSGGSPSTGSASSGSPTASTSSASGSPSTASPTTSGAAGAQSSNASTASAAKAQPSPIQQVFNQSAPLASSAPAQSPAAPPSSAPAPTTPAGAAPTAGTGAGAGGGLSTSGGPAPVAGAPAGAAPPAAPPVPLAPPTSPAPPAPPPTGAPGAAPAGLGAGVAPMSATSSSSGAAAAPIPVSQARAERDAVLAASTAGALRRKNNGSDPLQRARHIGAALNVGVKDFGFFWVTAVTTDGTIVVANSYGIGYIPDGVRLPENVRMASADDTIPADERAKWATYPILAVQGWAQHHELQLRAVVATEEQFANFDPGVAKIILTAEDIPDDGTMSGRTRLEVISPTAAQQLSAVGDFGLNDLLPPAPTDLEPPADQTATLWFEVAKPLMSTNPQRSAAHLQAFITYANHAQELAVYRAHTAAEPADQRLAIADWVYWQHLAVIMNDAVNADASA
ncbi:hypothetical protein KUF57_23480 [Mycolicibacterium sp. PAM1]|nr:hypothetical protein [Mycolicibacterium sp. PAM1]